LQILEQVNASGRHVRELGVALFATTRGATSNLGKETVAASNTWVTDARTASERFRKRVATVSRDFGKHTRGASDRWVRSSRAAEKQLVEGLRDEGMRWRQVLGSTTLLLRLQAPVRVREAARSGLTRRLETERATLERLRETLKLLDERLQRRLEGLDERVVARAEFALPADYDTLTVRKIAAESESWSHTEVLAALEHERTTKERSTVLGALQRRLEGLQQAS